MIERYTLTTSRELVQQRFGVEVPQAYQPHYNAAPTHLLPVILQGSAGVSFFYWGLPPGWAKNKNVSEKLVNVRVENIVEKASARKALKKFRCLLPADGFYRWKRVGKKTLIPYRYTLPDAGLFSMPALWEEFDDNEGNTHHTFMLLTTEGTEQDRTPVVFDKAKEALWMSAETTEEQLIELLTAPANQQLTFYTVSARINDISLNVPSLIMAAPPADQFGNLTLFD
jgi:putative SOS response-associated peptidase YedK